MKGAIGFIHLGQMIALLEQDWRTKEFIVMAHISRDNVICIENPITRRGCQLFAIEQGRQMVIDYIDGTGTHRTIATDTPVASVNGIINYLVNLTEEI